MREERAQTGPSALVSVGDACWEYVQLGTRLMCITRLQADSNYVDSAESGDRHFNKIGSLYEKLWKSDCFVDYACLFDF